MRTVVIPPPGILGFGRSRTVGVVARPLTGAQAYLIAVKLAARGLHVVPAVDSHRVLHLWSLEGPLSTADEVTVLAAYLAKTDARIEWHGAVAPC